MFTGHVILWGEQLTQVLRLLIAGLACTAICAGQDANTAPASRAGEIEQIPNSISAGREHGMISFQQCARELVARGVLAPETGLRLNPRPAAAG